VGGGIYHPHPPILKIRRHIAAHPEVLTRVLATALRATGGLADEDKLARPPKDSRRIRRSRRSERHFFGMIEISVAKRPARPRRHHRENFSDLHRSWRCASRRARRSDERA
jgi:hypothetical protein